MFDKGFNLNKSNNNNYTFQKLTLVEYQKQVGNNF